MQKQYSSDLQTLLNKQILLYVNLNNEKLVSKPISLIELCGKLSKRTGLKVHLQSSDERLFKLGTYKFNVKVNGSIETEMSVRLIGKPLKNKSKIVGLKSSIIKENDLILTGYGHKNETVLEHQIVDNQDKKLVDNTSYDVGQVDDINIEITNGKIKTKINNPLHVIRNDYLERKDVLEKQFFGRTFDDNLHIQLIYNILDIQKIFAIYVEDINYVLSNLGRPKYPEDFMGMVPSYVQYDDYDAANKGKFNAYFDRAYPYFIYFKDVLTEDFYSKKFVNQNVRKNIAQQQNNSTACQSQSPNLIDEKGEQKEQVYNIIRILSMCRQFAKHGKTNITSLFELDNQIKTNGKLKDVLEMVNNYYNKSMESLFKTFVKSSQKNIYLIMRALELDCNNKAEVKDVLNEYYNITINKSNTNLGFDFKRVRELLLSKLHLDVQTEDNGGYYQIINFVINYKLDKKMTDDIVSKLRLVEYQEEKDHIYEEFTNKLIPILKTVLHSELIESIRNEKLSNKSNYFNFPLDTLLSCDTSDTLFDKIVFFLCAFLEPKEINMFVTSLINKFENINSFIKVIKHIYGQDEIKFKNKYMMFSCENTEEYVKKLQVVLTISRMKKNITNRIKKETTKSKVYNEEMYKDSYYLFGLKGEYKTLHNSIFGIKGVKGAHKKTFKNFLLKSIINSNKFRYIVKYANPKECANIIQNEYIVRYVLGMMPETQIDKYCKSINFYSGNKRLKINKLVQSLKQININYIKDNYDNHTNRIVTLAGLYMSIIYIVIKQLVRINSYYCIAFSCLERDNVLYGKTNKEAEYLDLYLVKLFIDNKKMKPRVSNYLLRNINQYESIAKNVKDRDITSVYRATFRNGVQHLNSVNKLNHYLSDYKGIRGKMQSYFDLYQYIIQRVFFEEFDKLLKYNNKTLSDVPTINYYFEQVKKNGSYCRNLLHILCMPFAYNMARYKNLTIEDIFNDLYDEDLKIK